MGQEIVYCFKCQKRILGTEYAKGLAYQVANQICCSTCVVLVLDTLPPKAKEELLAKMFKATQERQSGSSASHKALGGPSPGSSTRKIPTTSGSYPDLPPRAAPESSSTTPIVIGVVVSIFAVLLAVLLLSGGSSAPPPPPVNTVKRIPPPPPPPPPDSGPTADEKRRAETAKDAMKKARDFGVASPRDLEGQARLWRQAVLEAERTGYEVEAKRELDKVEVRAKEAAGQELAELERQVRGPLGRKEFKATQDLIDQARGRRSTTEWTSLIERLQRELEETLIRSFAEVKEKAIAARDRGAKAEVESAKAQVARWGIPSYVADLESALQVAWRPLFDGKSATTFMVSMCADYWMVVDGALVHIPGKGDQAAQSKDDYGDGEFRFRISARGCSNFFVAVRQTGAGSASASFPKPAIEALGAGEHEIVFTCRGSDLAATIDGKQVKLEISGKVTGQGRIQFNYREGDFRVLAIEYRPLR